VNTLAYDALAPKLGFLEARTGAVSRQTLGVEPNVSLGHCAGIDSLIIFLGICAGERRVICVRGIRKYCDVLEYHFGRKEPCKRKAEMRLWTSHEELLHENH
jgi:hypothetical protein